MIKLLGSKTASYNSIDGVKGAHLSEIAAQFLVNYIIFAFGEWKNEVDYCNRRRDI